jgi:putative protease
VRFWQSVGIARIILSRELSLDEIAEIRQQCPDMELEVFVHGALCIAYSGRCLLSGYFNHRDSNQGACTNSCRWKYDLNPAQENPEGDYVPGQSRLSLADLNAPHPNPLPLGEGALLADCGDQERHPLANQVYFLEEENRPGEFMPVMEDEHGTYILNSKDLRAVEHVHRLVGIGVDSLKIEGRTKSHYYAARTAQAYRQAIDDALAGRPFDPNLLGMLENLAQRGYTDGFYQRHHTQAHQNYLRGYSESHRQRYVGEITAFDAASGMADVRVKNKFAVGDRLELILPEGNRNLVLAGMEDKDGHPLAEAPGSGWEVRIPLAARDARHGLIARYL